MALQLLASSPAKMVAYQEGLYFVDQLLPAIHILSGECAPDEIVWMTWMVRCGDG